MEKLFVQFIDYVTGFGNITEANMFKGGDYSNIRAETLNEQYVISVTISKKKEENSHEV